VVTGSPHGTTVRRKFEGPERCAQSQGMAHSRRLRARSGAIGLLGVCWCLARLASLVGCGAKHAGFDADDAGIASPTTEDDASTPSNEPLDGGAIGFAGDDATTHLDAGGGLCAVGTAGSFAMAGTLNLLGRPSTTTMAERSRRGTTGSRTSMVACNMGKAKTGPATVPIG
jgi:hypothetical protein